MLWLFGLYILLSTISTLILLSSPYLRLTSLGWLIGIWSLPILGAVFFLLTVVRKTSRSKNIHYHQLKRMYESADVEVKSKSNQLGVDHGFLPFFKLNAHQTLEDDDFLPAFYEALEQANDRIWITSYIFTGDVADEVLERLRAAHERGVQVKMLVDRVGSELIFGNKEVQQKIEAMPFDISIFRESLFKSIIFIEKRLHAKIAIIDKDFAFIGAHNLRDEIHSGHEHHALNVSLKIEGSVVQQLEAVFADIWFKNTDEELHVFYQEPNEAMYEQDETSQPSQEQDYLPARILHTDPISGVHAYDEYLTCLFMSAKRRIYIWSPYMIPSQTMRNTLIAQHRLGIDIKILIPQKSDSILVDHTHQLVIRELCDYGIPCFESVGDFDHSKMLMIDDTAIVGSANMDYRSLYRNYEANIEVHDPAFTQEMIEVFESRLNDAKVISDINPGVIRTMVHQLTSMIAALY